MKQLLENIELIGKTIERTGCLENQYFLFFTDGTFCIFADKMWEGKDVELDYDLFYTEPNLTNYRELKELEIIDQEKFDEFCQLSKQKDEEYRRKKDLEVLNELRKKYPDA